MRTSTDQAFAKGERVRVSGGPFPSFEGLAGVVTEVETLHTWVRLDGRAFSVAFRPRELVAA